MGEDSEPPAWPELIPAERAAQVRRIMVLHAGGIPTEQISEWVRQSPHYVANVVAAQAHRWPLPPVAETSSPPATDGTAATTGRRGR